MLLPTPSCKIIATILAKNEEDVIAHCIEHHLNNGVSGLILTDNNSTDRTKELASKYPEVLEIIDEPGENHNQSVWVTKMARLACKFSPDWIVHLDADEMWCGLQNLRSIQENRVGCGKLYLHPPVRSESIRDMIYFMNFDKYDIPEECKVAHRPDPNITITHGNHGFSDIAPVHYTTAIWRHHFPVRSESQFKRKAVEGHAALQRRGAICERWKRWSDCLCESNQIWIDICSAWERFIANPNQQDFLLIARHWSEESMYQALDSNGIQPQIGRFQLPALSKI